MVEGQRKPKILIVDDEERFRKTLSKLLVVKGFEVEQASSGKEAIEIVKNNDSLDIVLLDIRMPGIDGVDTLAALKKINPLLEVIVLTGHASVDVAVEIMQRGGYEYLLKPCDFDELLAKIDSAFERRMFRLEKARKDSELS